MITPVAGIIRYITELDKIYRAGNATEHSYRPALKALFENLTEGLTITNEPRHIDCGAPDYIITRNAIPLGYIEAKDIRAGLNNKTNKEQFDRYRRSLNNLIITDYLTFELYEESEPALAVTIAAEKDGGIAADKKAFDTFLEMVNRFTSYSGKTIYQPETLARIMADKAKLLAAIIRTSLKEKSEHDTLTGQYEGFTKILIHNLGIGEFADMYAQTLAYGLFAARLNQKDNQPFTRYLAARLIPQSNPFLQKFFNYIAGIELDSRITWIVDALADMFNRVAVEDILKAFGKAAQDPFIHFYETFLAEYDPALRELRGVYYTPVPVVKFIVQAVDDILKTEFNLKNGLADHSKIKRAIPGKDGKPETVELHKVQILDPATGTGTFLAEVIEKIFSYFARNKGAWADYCNTHLIPRINGFEILMASYAMAHFKLDMTLKETGYIFSSDARLQVYLTNSLEEPEKVEQFTLGMLNWLTDEAEEAKNIKKNTPVMVVLGNPPYSGESANITSGDFLAPYKKEPGGIDKLKEKNPKWLNDDYVKFIRYGQSFIEKNGDGVLAYINNHSFLDNPTFRGMRWHLLKTFDKIYILDLHGNSKKRETAPDGSKDENVFDIQVGVSINLFIKTGKKKEDELSQVFHCDVYGRRQEKYTFLHENTLASVGWQEITPAPNQYFLVRKSFANEAEYKSWFSPVDLFSINVMGFQTHRDFFAIDFNKSVVTKRIKDLLDDKLSIEEIKNTYTLSESNDWKLSKARGAIKTDKNWQNKIVLCDYRPFDTRYCFYSQFIIDRPRKELLQNVLNKDNYILGIGRQGSAVGGMDWSLAYVSKNPVDANIFRRGGINLFPLYEYPNELYKDEKRRPALNLSIVQKMEAQTGLRFTKEKEETENAFSPIDILDYIYAILYSNNYRIKYAEYLKIDFPRIPYPKNAEQFQKLAAIGSLLRNLHLMENVNPAMDMADFPMTGTNEVEAVKYQAEKAHINNNQYFENVPPQVWEYYIGGYQPAEKWLKDRKGRALSFEDIEHYQKIVFILEKTIKLQDQIDEVIEGEGDKNV